MGRRQALLHRLMEKQALRNGVAKVLARLQAAKVDLHGQFAVAWPLPNIDRTTPCRHSRRSCSRPSGAVSLGASQRYDTSGYSPANFRRRGRGDSSLPRYPIPGEILGKSGGIQQDLAGGPFYL